MTPHPDEVRQTAANPPPESPLRSRGPQKPRQRRPDYDRIRRFLKAGGVLQRETITTPSGVTFVTWCAATRDGRHFHALTCEWFRSLPTFYLDHSEGWLEEHPPGIFKRVPDIHPTLGEAAHYVNPDREPRTPADEGSDA